MSGYVNLRHADSSHETAKIDLVPKLSSELPESILNPGSQGSCDQDSPPVLETNVTSAIGHNSSSTVFATTPTLNSPFLEVTSTLNGVASGYI